MEIQYIDLNGSKLKGVKIPTNNTAILVIEAPKGFLGCGYFDIEVADKCNDAAAIVTGVKDLREMLQKPVQKVSKAAQELGVEVGALGIDALMKMVV